MIPSTILWLFWRGIGRGQTTGPILMLNDAGEEVGDWQRLCHEGCKVFNLDPGKPQLLRVRISLLTDGERQACQRLCPDARPFLVLARSNGLGTLQVARSWLADYVELTPRQWPRNIASRLRWAKHRPMFAIIDRLSCKSPPHAVFHAVQEFRQFWELRTAHKDLPPLNLEAMPCLTT